MKEEFIENKEALICLKSIFGDNAVIKVEMEKDNGCIDEIDDCHIGITATNLLVTFFNGNIVKIGTSEWGWIEKYEKTN